MPCGGSLHGQERDGLARVVPREGIHAVALLVRQAHGHQREHRRLARPGLILWNERVEKRRRDAPATVPRSPTRNRHGCSLR